MLLLLILFIHSNFVQYKLVHNKLGIVLTLLKYSMGEEEILFQIMHSIYCTNSIL